MLQRAEVSVLQINKTCLIIKRFIKEIQYSYKKHDIHHVFVSNSVDLIMKMSYILY